jgi:hypothetical protein
MGPPGGGVKIGSATLKMTLGANILAYNARHLLLHPETRKHLQQIAADRSAREN